MARYEDADWRTRLRVRLDYTNALADAVGLENGVSDDQLRQVAPRCANAVANLQELRSRGLAEWLDLPYDQEGADRIVAFADALAPRCDAFVVLGIGGSALGASALQTALHHPFYNQLPPERRGYRPRIYVVDNVDPDFVAGILDLLDLKRTVFNVVTKSGRTAETMAQLAIIRDRLVAAVGSETPNHLVVTTDPRDGDLRELARREGYQTFDIPPTVGGRFSVLSAAGLLPTAVSGADVRELLAGAAEADRYCRGGDLWRNPAALNAAILFLLYERGKHITVMMPYSQRLRDVADWFRQLWAESLGKTRVVDGQAVHVGLTPVKALGVTDQHSQVQLYVDGPPDKVINFLGVDRFHETVDIPTTNLGLSSLDYLGGHSLNQLINVERMATALALAEQRRPNCTFLLPEVNAFTVGQLLYVLEVQTAVIGDLLGVNPFDQPGVEAGKRTTHALLGRRGYQKAAQTPRGRIEANRRVA